MVWVNAGECGTFPVSATLIRYVRSSTPATRVMLSAVNSRSRSEPRTSANEVWVAATIPTVLGAA